MTEKNNINFVDKLILTNESYKLIDKGATINEVLTDNFKTKMIFFIIVFLIFIIVMASISSYTTYIKNNLFTFIIETIIYSIVCTLPFIFMEKYRKTDNYRYLYVFLIGFFSFAILNILYEISGMYNYYYVDPNKISILPEKQSNFKNNLFYALLYTCTIVTLFIFISIIIISFRVRNFDIDKSYLLLETFIFSLANSLPFILIAYNRQKSKFNLNRCLINVVFIFISCIVINFSVQGSGYYDRIFVTNKID